MIKTISLRGTDPRRNLASEESCLEQARRDGVPVFLLWRNENAVILGRNQNAFAECDMEAVRRNHTLIVRRMSGGGAVYHDLGNLNFSFILPAAQFDPSACQGTILEGLRALGIPAKSGGRNDLYLAGKKISGMASWRKEDTVLYHGTLMHSVGTAVMQEVLSAPGSKFVRRGVASRRSPVVNLQELVPDLTMEALKSSLLAAVIRRWGPAIEGPGEEPPLDPLLLEKYSSVAWNLNRLARETRSMSYAFSWGELQIHFVLRDRRVERTELFSDSLYPDLVDQFNDCLAQHTRPAVAGDPALEGIRREIEAALADSQQKLKDEGYEI